MANLAEKIIAANKDFSTNEFGELIEKDDIGLSLPADKKDKLASAEYLLARLLYLNPNIYKYSDCLWLNGQLLTEDQTTYYRLSRIPTTISLAQTQYVWQRCKEIVPELNPEVISITPNLLYNMKTGRIKDINEEATIITLTSNWENKK